MGGGAFNFQAPLMLLLYSPLLTVCLLFCLPLLTPNWLQPILPEVSYFWKEYFLPPVVKSMLVGDLMLLLGFSLCYCLVFSLQYKVPLRWLLYFNTLQEVFSASSCVFVRQVMIPRWGKEDWSWVEERSRGWLSPELSSKHHKSSCWMRYVTELSSQV